MGTLGNRQVGQIHFIYTVLFDLSWLLDWSDELKSVAY